MAIKPIFKVKNKNTVEIALASSCYYQLANRPGNAIARIQTGDRVFYKTINLEGTTDTRLRIQILIDIIKDLPEPTHIILHSATLGLQKIVDKQGHYKPCPPTKINADLLNQLQEALITGGHDIEETKTNKYRQYLKREARAINDNRILE